jgi:phosphoenolpyruvate-protein phosphotransferase (PTS system enzyme I)
MQDPLMTDHIEKQILQTLKNAEHVVQTTVKEYQIKFNSIQDPIFRERFKDIQDVARRITAYLTARKRLSLKDIPANSIVFAKELSPSMVAEANNTRIKGFVSQVGASNSHVAIVARARGVPYVSNINFNEIESFHHCIVIIDGRTGEVIIDPTSETLEKYYNLQEKLDDQITHLKKVSALASETYDGYRVQLCGNVETANELEILHKFGGNGVGLYRSEYIFLQHQKFPSEEEQFVCYRQMVEQMRGLPIVIRTFDLGGDKFPKQHGVAFEANPFLGCRAIRFMLKERDLFKTQLRAILRASAFGHVSIMFPMISSSQELIEAKEIVKEVQLELTKAGIKSDPHIRMGCMIEVPSAAVTADLLAKECDFFSIGTNDLVQYAMAVDRDSHQMSGFYSPTHPSVIRLIRLIISEANNQGIPVSVCGEIAADPRFTPLLLGLGVHQLSVGLHHIPIVRNAIRNTSIVAAAQLVDKVLTLTTAEEIQDLLNEEYLKTVPEDHLYNI